MATPTYTRTIDIGFSGDTGQISNSKAYSHFFNLPISTINSKLHNNLESNFRITNLKVTVTASYYTALWSNTYIKFGFGNSGSISKELQGEDEIETARIGMSNKSGPESYTKDITSYLASVNDPFSLKTNYGSYLVFNIYTANIGKKRFLIESVKLTVTFEIFYTLQALCFLGDESNSNCGTISGTGTYDSGTVVTLTATPNKGYKFVKWDNGSTSPTISVTVDRNLVYYAYFEVDKTNKIYIGTAQPKAIYIGTQEVKEVYVGTSKVYG